MMGQPVVVAPYGKGLPVIESDNDFGLPVEIASNGRGTPVVYVTAGPALPVKTAAYQYANSEASALVARFSSEPSNGRKSLIDAAIGGLKAAGVWSKLDGLHVLAAHNAQAAQRNWKADAFNLSVSTGTPVFTADRGYATDGASSKLTTGFNPTTAGGGFALNSAFVGVWARNLAANGRFGNDTSRVGWGATPAHYSRGNDASTMTGNVASSARFFSWSRDAAGSYARYVNGAAFDTQSVTSTALTNNVFLLGETNGSFGAGPYSVICWGSALTAVEMLALHNVLRAYLLAVGAV